MTAPAILVIGALLERRVEAWPQRYDIVTPHMLESGTFPRDRIEVIVTFGEHFPNALVETLPGLRLVACFSTGYAGIDLHQLRARDIILTNAAGINAHDVADHAISLLLSQWHGIVAADARLRNGGWREDLVPRRSLKGAKAGIVGLGRIGLEVAARLHALHVQVSWWGPNEKPSAPHVRAASLLELARANDILIVTSRAIPENRHQIDAEVLSALGAGGVIVNVSRGMLIDENALIDALRTRRIHGAALDVFQEEPTSAERWSDVPNVVLTPHIAGFTREAGRDMDWQLQENVRRYFASEPLLSPVTDA